MSHCPVIHDNVGDCNTANLNFRHLWMEGIREVRNISHFLAQVGSRFFCVLKNRTVIVYTSSFSYHPERIVFSETDENKDVSTYFILEKTGSGSSRLTIDLYRKNSLIWLSIYRLLKKSKIESNRNSSLLYLEELLNNIELPEGM